jgi:hypothetical protein
VEEKRGEGVPMAVALLVLVALMDALEDAVGAEGVAPLLALLTAVAVAGAVPVPWTLPVEAAVGVARAGDGEDASDAVLAGVRELAWRAEDVIEGEAEAPTLLVEDAEAKGELEAEVEGVALEDGELSLEPTPEAVEAALTEVSGVGVKGAVPPALGVS